VAEEPGEEPPEIRWTFEPGQHVCGRVRTIGIARAKAKIGLQNLAYTSAGW
jgi:hypothetical protein